MATAARHAATLGTVAARWQYLVAIVRRSPPVTRARFAISSLLKQRAVSRVFGMRRRRGGMTVAFLLVAPLLRGANNNNNSGADAHRSRSRNMKAAGLFTPGADKIT